MPANVRLWWEMACNEVRYAGRRLARSPVFTIVSALSLAIGIGANTAAFGVLYAVLLRPLPVHDPSSLALVSLGRQNSMTYPSYTYLRDYSRSLGGLVAFATTTVNLASGGATERVSGMLVSGNYFSVLGVEMAIGSPIREDDDRTPESGGARGPVAVLSHQIWNRRFHGDPAIAGKSIRVNGELFTVIGVAPASFRGTRVGSFPDVFVPMAFARSITTMPNALTGGSNHWIRVIARIEPGVETVQAQAEMNATFQRFTHERLLPTLTNEASRKRALGRSIRLRAGSAGLLEMDEKVRPSLYLSMGLMTLVLLIACANVANLLVARAERSRRDTAIHVALGASSGRLWARTLTESLMLGGLGVACGLVLAVLMRGLLAQLIPANQQIDLRMDAQVLGVSVLAGFAAAVFLAMVTTWQTSWQTTRHGGVTVAGALRCEETSARLWLRKGLIAGQLALSVVVLVAAALFGQTLRNLHRVDPGFERGGVLIASLDPSGLKREAQGAFYQQLLDEVRATAGVVSASLAEQTPLGVNTWWGLHIRREATAPPSASAPGPVPGASAEAINVPVAFVAPGYFMTMGIPFVRGRDLDPWEDGATSATVVVNQSFARRLLGRGDVIGATVSGNGNMVFTIAGVVRDSAALGLRSPDEPVMYVPLGRTPRGRLAVHIRAAVPVPVPPIALAAAIEATVRRIAPDVPIYDVHTIDQEIDRLMNRERTFARLTSVFGALALLLSAVGVYGLMAYAVSRRVKELGIRIALGAAPHLVVRLVLRDAVLLVAGGLAFGMLLASALAGTVERVLFGVQPGDWRSLATASLVLLVVTLLSAWLPARRAAAIDPLVALRQE